MCIINTKLVNSDKKWSEINCNSSNGDPHVSLSYINSKILNMALALWMWRFNLFCLQLICEFMAVFEKWSPYILDCQSLKLCFNFYWSTRYCLQVWRLLSRNLSIYTKLLTKFVLHTRVPAVCLINLFVDKSLYKHWYLTVWGDILQL